MFERRPVNNEGRGHAANKVGERAARRSGWLRHHFGIRSATLEGNGRVLRVAPVVALINKNLISTNVRLLKTKEYTKG